MDDFILGRGSQGGPIAPHSQNLTLGQHQEHPKKTKSMENKGIYLGMESSGWGSQKPQIHGKGTDLYLRFHSLFPRIQHSDSAKKTQIHGK